MFVPVSFSMLEGIDLASAVAALTSLGVLPVITIAATISIAVVLYKRFRK